MFDTKTGTGTLLRAPCSGSLGKIYEVWIEFLPPPSLARNKRNIWASWCKKYSWSFFMWYFRNVKFWRVLVHWFHLKPRKHRIKKKQMLKINSVQVLHQKSLRKREYLRGLDLVFPVGSLVRDKRNIWGWCKNGHTVCSLWSEPTLSLCSLSCPSISGLFWGILHDLSQAGKTPSWPHTFEVFLVSFSLHDPMIRRTVLDIFYSRRLFFLLQSSKVGFVQISLQIFRSNNDVKGRGYAPTEFFSVKLGK